MTLTDFIQNSEWTVQMIENYFAGFFDVECIACDKSKGSFKHLSTEDYDITLCSTCYNLFQKQFDKKITLK